MSEFHTLYRNLTIEVVRLGTIVNQARADVDEALNISPNAADAALEEITTQLERCMLAQDALENEFGWGEHYDVFFQFQNLPADVQEKIRKKIRKLSRRSRRPAAIPH